MCFTGKTHFVDNTRDIIPSMNACLETPKRTNNELHNRPKIVIFGGNGFVGTHVAEQLANRDLCVICLSRTGHKPIHLKDEAWSTSIRWCKGDASEPNMPLLSSSDIVISLVGSAPLPTMSKDAFQHQLFMNGVTNVNLINAAAKAGVKRIVLLGAKIPSLLKRDGFGYAKGKRLALEAAEEFSTLSDKHTAIVLQPGAIFGTRHLKNGKAIPLGSILKPISYLIPWQFVSVDSVASAVAHAAISDAPYAGKFTVLAHNRILSRPLHT